MLLAFDTREKQRAGVKAEGIRIMKADVRSRPFELQATLELCQISYRYSMFVVDSLIFNPFTQSLSLTAINKVYCQLCANLEIKLTIFFFNSKIISE